MMVITLVSPIKCTKNDHSNDLKSFAHLVNLMMILTVGLVVAESKATTRPRTDTNFRYQPTAPLGRRGLGGADLDSLETSEFASSRRPRDFMPSSVRYSQPESVHHHHHHHSSSQDLTSADQMDEPTFTSPLDQGADQDRANEPLGLDNFSQSNYQPVRSHQQQQQHNHHRDSATNNDNIEDDEAMENSHDSPDRNVFMNSHNTHLRAMRDMFERRHLDHNNNNNNRHHLRQQAAAGNPLQSSQELNPISIGLDPGSPFNMPPFPMGPNDGASPPPAAPLPPMGVHMKSPMSNADNLDGQLGPTLPFGLNPLPHLLGFQSSAFDGPQRGDQSAHSNHHAAAAPQPDTEMAGGTSAGGAVGSGQKSWPKIFRFTDGRINLSDFEKQKKIRLSNKNQHGENHIESAPLMFDGRPLKRKSFLILHGGVFPGN